MFYRYLMDVTKNRTRKSLYKHFIQHNIASVKANSMCIPSNSDVGVDKNSHSCHIVYMDGAPSYPATGTYYHAYKAWIFNTKRSCVWYGLDRSIQRVQANPANFSLGPVTCRSGGRSKVLQQYKQSYILISRWYALARPANMIQNQSNQNL